MEEIIDLIATDASASDISNKIKEVLFAKAAERIEDTRPFVATSLFGEVETTETEDSEDNN